MGALFGGTPAPPAIPVTPPAATPPTMGATSPSSNAVASNRARAAAASMTQGGTIGGQGPQGVLSKQESTAPQTLLGQ